MATSSLRILISSSGGVTVVRNIQQIGQAARDAARPLENLQRSIHAVMAALAIRQITEWADEWTAAANKISVFAKSQDETNTVLDRLFGIAQKLGVPLNGVVDLYHKLSIQSKSLGVSTNENIQFTENVSKSLAIQGTSAASARGALLQLSQAMGTGKVKAQEYNSLLTGMPLLLKMAAENIDKAGGSVAKLTGMQRAGELSSKMLFDAIQKSTGRLDELFGKMDKTFAQGMSTLETGLVRFFGEMNKSLGLSNAFFQVAMFISDNLNTIVKVLGVIGVAIIAAFAPAILALFAAGLTAIIGGLITITGLLLANPFVVIAAAVAAVVLFGDSWLAGIDNITTVKDLLRAFVDVSIEAFNQLVDVISAAWEVIKTNAQGAYEFITGEVTGAVGSWFQSYSDFFDNTGNGFIGLLQKIAKVMDAIGGLILGAIMGMMRAFAGLPPVVEQVYNQLYNIAAGWMEKIVNVTIQGINVLRDQVGLGWLPAVKMQLKDVDKKVYTEYGKSIAGAMDEGFDIQGNYLEKKVIAFGQRAQDIARNRLSRRTLAPPGLDERSTPEEIAEKAKKGKKAAAEKKDPLPDQLRRLLDRIDPAKGAVLEMAEAMKILTAAEDAKLITGAEHLQYLVSLELHYRDIKDPFGKYIRELDDEYKAMGVGTREMEIKNAVVKAQHELLKKSHVMTEQEIADLTAHLERNQAMNISIQAQNALLDESVNKRRSFGEQIAAIQKLQSNPNSGFTKNDATNAMMRENADLFAGTQEALDARVGQFQEMYTKIDMMRQAGIVSEQSATQMRAKVWAQEQEFKLKDISSFFSQLEGLSSSSNKKVAAIGKAAAVANATIKGYEAFNVALASAPPPYNYALAAAVAASAAVNVAKILSTNSAFAIGGDFKVGGSGGVDSQMVAFRASPGEQVSVSTPTQVRKGSASKDSSVASAPVNFNPRIINVMDPDMIGDYLNTAEGSQVVINHIRKNADSVRQAINNG